VKAARNYVQLMILRFRDVGARNKEKGCVEIYLQAKQSGYIL
jgi:hypothetical protein